MMVKGLLGQVGGTQLGQQAKTNELLAQLVMEQRQTNLLLVQLLQRFIPRQQSGTAHQY